MRDTVPISAGLVVFLALVALPIWYGLRPEAERGRPALEWPADTLTCVEDSAYMAANHMTLLNQWRRAVVRTGELDYTAASGTRYRMSLTGTCLDCHQDRDAFCTRCHDYADVHPNCWNCHVGPQRPDDE